MRFNKYLWGLYKTTKEYKKMTKYAKDIQSLDKFFDNIKYEDKKEEKEFKRFFKKLYTYLKNKNFTLNNVEKVFETCIKEGIPLKYYNDIYIEENDPFEWCYSYAYNFFSDALYLVLPDFFFLYRFNADNIILNFNVFQKICDEFEISLTPMPTKKDKIGRALYYVKICKSLYEFRKECKLTPEELYAFIYDFGYKNIMYEIEKNEEEIPSPSKVWYIVDRYYNNADNITKEIDNYTKPIPFEVSKDARIGDILFLYCSKPHSGLHSVWRVYSTSFEDVFCKNYKVGIYQVL